jgi:alpha-tubulin suppressor-like RCC1 family protein
MNDFFCISGPGLIRPLKAKFFLIIGVVFVFSQCLAAPPGYVVYWGRGGDINRGPMDYSVGVVTKDGSMVSNAVSIAAGSGFGLALLDDGTVLGWGENRMGQATGIRSSRTRTLGSVFVGTSVLSNVVALAAGWSHGIALRNDGTMVGWGTEYFSADPLLVPLDITNLLSFASGYGPRYGVAQDGQVLDLFYPQKILNLSNAIAVAVQRTTHPTALALLEDGRVMQFANAGFPSYETNTPSLSNIIAISCGDMHNLALSRDGRVYGWGRNGYGEATGIPSTNSPFFSDGWVSHGGKEVTNVVAIAGGTEYSLGIRFDGTLVNWGYTNNRAFPLPLGLTNAVAVASGFDLNIVIVTNREVASRLLQ